MNEFKLEYYAYITPEDGAFLVNFRDFPSCITYGETLEDALFYAREALDLVLEEMADSNSDVPPPSKGKPGEYPIIVSPEVAALLPRFSD